MSLTQLFQGLTVRDIWPRGREILVLQEDESVGSCLAKLDYLQIVSAPVINSYGELSAVLDLLDIVCFCLTIFPKDIYSKDLTAEEMRRVVDSGKCFQDSTVKDVLSAYPTKTAKCKSYSVERGTPIQSLLSLFQRGIHRVIVLGSDNKTPINIISQSDMLSVLTQCIPFADEKLRLETVEKLGLVACEPSQLNIGTTDLKTIEILRLIHPETSHPYSAVPIVDSDGKIVANFSASNLRGLRKENFVTLLYPVIDFLTLHRDTGKFGTIIERGKSLHPLHISRLTSFENAVLKMNAHHIHRLWVVEEGKPIGVISIGDLFKVFLPVAPISP